MAFYNGFVKTQVKVTDGDQLTVGAKAVLLSGVFMEGKAAAVFRGVVTAERDAAVMLQNGRDWDVTIESTALVTGTSSGLVLGGSKGTLANAGRVWAAGTGVFIHGENNDFRNTGSVDGGYIGVDFASVSGTLVNEAGATISGDRIGISSDSSITNFGTIAGSVAIRFGGSGQELVNKGEILGNIEVRGYENVLDMRGGQLSGVIRQEQGSTVVLVDDSDLRFVSSGGESTVKSSVDYILGNGVGKLVLTGTADINGQGNNDHNRLVGNDGNNVLQGKQGFDVLDGGKGDDTLTGGAGRDIFVFQSGDGQDIITDFRTSGPEDQRDRIDLGELGPRRYDFDTFMSEHVRNDQGNVIIAFEDLTITLMGLRKSALSYEDFSY